MEHSKGGTKKKPLSKLKPDDVKESSRTKKESERAKTNGSARPGWRREIVKDPFGNAKIVDHLVKISSCENCKAEKVSNRYLVCSKTYPCDNCFYKSEY